MQNKRRAGEYRLISREKKSVVIIVAVLTIYVLDFAINVVQWSSRSLIVDSLPTSKQQLGSAWGECFPLGKMTLC